MKEVHLTPNLWVVSAKKVFLPKLRIWREEISYWKMEATQFKKLIGLGLAYGKEEDRRLLGVLEEQLNNFLSVEIPPVEQSLHPLERVLIGKGLGCQFRDVETRIEELRTTYYHLKIQLLPFLTKFVSTSIW